MKKIISFIASLTALLLILTACSSKTEPKKEEKKEPVTVKVASHTSPMTDMLEMIKEDLKKEGYNLEIVKVSDNVQANVALNNKEVDANFFQHKPFNQKNNAKLVAVQPIYNATVSFYSKTLKDIKDLKDGADVAIPSDPTNLARALRLLDHAKVITLKDPNSFTVTEADIKDNPKHLKFTKVSLLNLNEAYNEKDLVFNYPTYISKLGLTPDKNGLALEKADDLTFAISLVAREDNKDDAKVQAVKKALASEKVKEYINKELKPKGHATPAF